LEFIVGERSAVHTYPLAMDMERIAKSIREAKKQSDCVIVSIHSHQFSAANKQNPAEFIRIFSKVCIDVGASIIVGHGPHVLRGVERYKNGVILYGLGNFIFQNETVPYLPAEYYEKYSLQPDDGVGTAMEKRNKNGTIGLANDKDSWSSVLASIEVEGKRICIGFHPLELGYELPQYRRGLPKKSRSNDGVLKIKELSSQWGTDINILDGIGSLIISY
jgi:hypothetical protein